MTDGVSREWIEAGEWTIDVASERMAVDAQLAGFCDPKSEREGFYCCVAMHASRERRSHSSNC